MAPKRAIAIFIQANITVWKKLETCLKQHLLSSRFIKVFYKMTTCPRRPLLSGPKSGRLVQVWLYVHVCSIHSIIKAFTIRKTSDINFDVYSISAINLASKNAFSSASTDKIDVTTLLILFNFFGSWNAS